MKPTDVRYFDSPAAFRAWLDTHHLSADPIWLAIAKKGCSHHVLTHPDALDAALCYGWIDGMVGRIDDEHFSLRFSRRRPGSNWSAVNVARMAALQASGVMHPAGLAAFESRDRTQSEDRPAELDAASVKAFKAHPAAWRFFERQPPGYRRQASWYVLSARTPVTRQRRLLKLIELSALGQRLPAFA